MPQEKVDLRNDSKESKSDSLIAVKQALFDRINLAEAWEITKGDPKVLVGLIDNGFDFFLPDLKGQLIPGIYYSGGYHADFYESEELDAKQLSDRLRGALAAISAEQPEVFVMRYVDQLTYDKIVERTNSNRKSSTAMNRTFGREVSAAVNSSTCCSTEQEECNKLVFKYFRQFGGEFLIQVFIVTLQSAAIKNL